MAAALLFPAGLAAHGVETAVTTGATDFRAESVRFTYSTGEIMSFARIRVYAPSRPDTETLQSITDRSGYYGFVPDEEGEWRITAEDGMGHKGEITLTVGAPGESAAAAPSGSGSDSGSAPLGLRIILGLSLILNIFAVYNFVLPRLPKKRSARAYQ